MYVCIILCMSIGLAPHHTCVPCMQLSCENPMHHTCLLCSIQRTQSTVVTAKRVCWVHETSQPPASQCQLNATMHSCLEQPGHVVPYAHADDRTRQVVWLKRTCHHCVHAQHTLNCVCRLVGCVLTGLTTNPSLVPNLEPLEADWLSVMPLLLAEVV